MTKTTLTKTLPFVMALALAACGGREVNPPGNNNNNNNNNAAGLQGDWFGCDDAACARIQDEGMRLFGGRWALLQAPGKYYEPGESYTVHEPWGSYSVHGDRIELTPPQGQPNELDGVARVIITPDSDDGDRATAVICDGDECQEPVAVIRVGPGAPIDPSALGPLDQPRAPSPVPDVPPSVPGDDDGDAPPPAPDPAP